MLHPRTSASLTLHCRHPRVGEATLAPPSVISAVLDHVDLRHGGAAAHLRACGADPRALDSWQSVLIETHS